MCAWNSISPDGSKSVKDNTPLMQANTAYIEATMNKDHFWNIGANEDGHHKYVQMPAYTVGGNPADPALATGMSGEVYFRTVSATNPRIEAFYRNSNGIFQIGPSYQTGTIALTSSYANVAAVPDNSYGLIFILSLSSADTDSAGYFMAAGGVVQSYVNVTVFGGSSTPGFNHKFSNGSDATDLNIKVRTNGVPNGLYGYKIIYWGN